MTERVTSPVVKAKSISVMFNSFYPVCRFLSGCGIFLLINLNSF